MKNPSRSQRIGYVLKKFPRLSETFVLNEILGVEASGNEVTVFTHRPPDDEPRHPELELVRAEVTLLPPFGSQATFSMLGRLQADTELVKNLGAALQFCSQLPDARRMEILLQGVCLAAEVRQRGLDHLHAHFMTVAAHLAHIAHLLTHVPYSVTAHAKDIYRHGIDTAVFQAVAKRARAIITVCDANHRHIRKHLLGDSPCELIRIYNGLPLLEILKDPATPREPALIVAVGRLVEKKGLGVLLEACKILKSEGRKFECVIVGDGEERVRLETLALELGVDDRVRFLGAAPRKVALDWMRRARVLAAPCLTGTDGNQDALPTVLIEALALSLPSVSTPVAGIPEIITDGRHGLIVPERDPKAFAQGLARMLDDHRFWGECSSRCRPHAEALFDQRKTLPQLQRVFLGRPLAAIREGA